MELGTFPLESRHSLLWPVIGALLLLGTLCRLNLPAGEPRLELGGGVEFGDDLPFLGELLQAGGSALIEAAGDWQVYDLGVLRVARWTPEEWVAEEGELGPAYALALPFAEGWRELSRSGDR